MASGAISAGMDAVSPPAGPQPVQIVGAREVGALTRLEPLARRIFGPGDRPTGWFARKLRREHVDPQLSVVAVRANADPTDPDAWRGYVLVGTPPSLAPATRTAGTGVLPSVRGQGIGGRLLDEAARRSRAAGHHRLQLLSAADVVPFYLGHGFARVHDTVTLVAFGTGPAAELTPPPLWRSPRPDEHEPVAWLPEAWAGTDPRAQRGLTWIATRSEVAAAADPASCVQAWLSKEGAAWLVQRILAPRDHSLLACAAGLLARLPEGCPVLLPLLRAHDCATATLLEHEWVPAQRSTLLERTL